MGVLTLLRPRRKAVDPLDKWRRVLDDEAYWETYRETLYEVAERTFGAVFVSGAKAGAKLALREQRVLKHLPGQHNQQTHGRGHVHSGSVSVLSEAEVVADLENAESVIDGAFAYSQAEIEEIQIYSGNSYSAINGNLREGNLLEDTPFEETVLHMDSALESNTLPGDLVTWRGMHDVDLEVGDVFSDLGYISTSIAPSTALTFAKQSYPPALARIKARAGTHAVEGNGNEDELIFPRGSSFLVTGHSILDDVPVYEMEIVS